MQTIYVRISDLEELEDICPPGVDEHLDVHIVSDPAWETTATQVTIACEESAANGIAALLPSAKVLPMDNPALSSIRRRFGC